MKTPTNLILFTDETRVLLDSPDCWKKGWLTHDQRRREKFFRQIQGGNIMKWAGIYENKILGPF